MATLTPVRKTWAPSLPPSSNEPRTSSGTQLGSRFLIALSSSQSRSVHTCGISTRIVQFSNKVQDSKMKLPLICAVLLALGVVDGSPINKNEAVDELSPLNEVYVIQNSDDERSDRDKRKIGIVKLGVSNGIINFVFGKLDAFLDAKTKALSVLDEGNKAKNAAFDIDSSKSSTTDFISKYIASKLKATTGSVGPLINAGTTFLTSAKQGIAGAFASKFAPLSSLSGGLSGGLSSGGGNDHAGGGSNTGSFLSGIIGGLSGSSNNGGSDNGVEDPSDYPIAGQEINGNGGYASVGAGVGKY